VIVPVIADAATVAGEARYISAFGLPILPMKFLLEELTQASPAAIRPK
jgi:hypothetical protein